MLLKIILDKSAFVKFKISNNIKQDIDDTHSTQPKIHKKIHTCLWILKNLVKKIRKPKVWRLLPNVCDFRKPNHTLKIYRKSIAKPMDFFLCEFHLWTVVCNVSPMHLIDYDDVYRRAIACNHFRFFTFLTHRQETTYMQLLKCNERYTYRFSPPPTLHHARKIFVKLPPSPLQFPPHNNYLRNYRHSHHSW